MVIPPDIKIKERSLLAKTAAWKMGASRVALVIGRTIYLHNISAAQFSANHRWVRHELKHVEQYRRLGTFAFLVLYGWYSLRYGYFNNPFEKEARDAEEGF